MLFTQAKTVYAERDSVTLGPNYWKTFFSDIFAVTVHVAIVTSVKRDFLFIFDPTGHIKLIPLLLISNRNDS